MPQKAQKSLYSLGFRVRFGIWDSPTDLAILFLALDGRALVVPLAEPVGLSGYTDRIHTPRGLGAGVGRNPPSIKRFASPSRAWIIPATRRGRVSGRWSVVGGQKVGQGSVVSGRFIRRPCHTAHGAPKFVRDTAVQPWRRDDPRPTKSTLSPFVIFVFFVVQISRGTA